MMVVDTSALMAMLMHQSEANACKRCLTDESETLLPAGTAAEALVVALGRGLLHEMTKTIEDFDMEIVPVTAASAQRIGKIYAKWGKGMHPAGLNFGDCFAYELAKSRHCKLLFVGKDFSRTDIEPAL
jgi:ribonuclease VapC